MESSFGHLEKLISDNHPLIATESPPQERKRLLTHIAAYCQTANRKAYIWTISEDNIKQITINSSNKLTFTEFEEYKPKVKQNKEDYFHVLNFWKDYEEQGILIIENIYPWIKEDTPKETDFFLVSEWIKSSLINLKLYNQDSGKIAMLLGATAEITSEIAAEIPLWTQELPDVQEIIDNLIDSKILTETYSFELVTAITPWLGEWVIVKIAEAILGNLNTQIKPKELEKALKVCVATADRQVKLFWRCEPRFIPKLLEHLFQSMAEELQRPFKSQGTLQVEYLVTIFQKVLEEHPKIKQNIDESLIQPWLEVFAKNYFETTDLYLRYKISQVDYLQQITNYFDDIKFAGIAVEGKEIDKSAKLIDIFVMPDVVENFNQISPPDFPIQINNRQAELIWEQRQAVRTLQYDGEKLLAQQLLNENKSNKIVLLGAPGSGKTTLMNYFAVTLAQKQNDTNERLPILVRIRDLARRTDNISMLMAQQHRKKISKFIKYILEIDTPYEQWLHRNLFFATSCLSEDIDIVDENLLTDIFHKLIQLEIAYSDLVGDNVQRQVYNSICNLQETKFAAKMLILLNESAHLLKKIRWHHYRSSLGEKDEAKNSLLSMLKSGTRYERFRSAETLSILKNDSEEVVEELIKQVQEEDTQIRRFAAMPLARLEKKELAAQLLIPMLRDENYVIRGNAAEALGRLNHKPEVVEALLISIEDEQYSVRYRAAEALGLLGNVSPRVVNELTLMLEDEDCELRYRAAEVLMKSSDLFKPYQVLIPALISKLNDKEFMVRLRVTTALGELGDSSDKVIQALILKFEDEETSVRGAAARALVKLGKPSLEIRDVLVKLIEQYQDSRDVKGEIHVLWNLVEDENN
ncbi:MAG: HEAT repeat domain-containing protein [Scytonematopsis contorta HA4267-MV1]|jgi:HEAT repeat protein|nr:HEAT repeat domain-containing protein [Scytonematopsis contorta HA4267-MV1]